MKKLLILSGLMVILLASCKKNEPAPPPVPPPVEDPAPPPAPTPTTTTTTTNTTTVVKEEEKPDGTSISINKDGVKFESKDGQNENKVNVTTKKDAEVEIKRKN
jgi:nitrous oxide reductase accessory protein NosL